MLLPHRTAWTTPLEFQAVFSDLFESDGDPTRQSTALSRIAVWQSRATCPHAVESTANFLRLILLDSTSAVVKPSAHELRLSYSMAIIRFVNSLVDPLQTAYFARSISSLAAQLGLPLWFVELRHQATHEDLPGLPVLREGARQALDWLYSHYWLPAISSSSSSSTASSSTLPPLPTEPFLSALNSYKSLMKTLQKDASQSGTVKNELGRVWRELERWGTENGFTFPVNAAGTGRVRKQLNPNGKGVQESMRVRERAMEAVVEALVDEPGWLVPLAKKKRPTTRSPSLPQPLLELYTPLLDFLDETLFAPAPASAHSTSPGDDDDDDTDSFIDTLISKIVDIVCASDDSRSSEEQDPTYFLTLQAWVLHLLPIPAADPSESEFVEAIETVLKTCLIAGTPHSISLVEALLRRSRDADLPQFDRVEPLLNMLRNRDSGFARGIETEQADRIVGEMIAKADAIERSLASQATTSNPDLSVSSPQPLSSAPAPSAQVATSTWTILPNFRSTPIGSLPNGGFEGLDLTRETAMEA